MSGIPLGLFLVGVLIGHAAVALWLLNRAHSLGLEPSLMHRLAAAPLLVPAAVALAMAWAFLMADPFGPSGGVASRSALGYGVFCNLIAWLCVPAHLLRRWTRRAPPGVGERSEPLALVRVPDWIGEGKYAWMLGLPGNESLSLDVRTWTIPLGSIPPSFRALRVLHLSDLHFSASYDRGYFEAVSHIAAGWEADLVLFTGDLLDDEETLDWTVPVLGRLRGRLGQFAVLGNHDVVFRPGRVRRALRAAGFTVIDGRWARVEDDRISIALGGTSAPWGPALDPENRPEADATIVLSHSPDEFPRISSWGTVDLVVSGHNHGGQVCLPGIGPLVMPSRYGLRYEQGVFRRGRTLMEVTRGVGGRHPLRYGCPPEVVHLVLTPAPRAVVPHRERRRGDPAPTS